MFFSNDHGWLWKVFSWWDAREYAEAARDPDSGSPFANEMNDNCLRLPNIA